MAVDNKHTFNFIRVVWHITINIISRLEKFGNLSDDYKKNHKVGSWEKKKSNRWSIRIKWEKMKILIVYKCVLALKSALAMFNFLL